MKRKSARAGKRRKTRRQDKTDWTGWLDGLNDRCRNIGALAGLIEACDPEVTRPDVVQNVGSLICEEASQLKELVRSMENKVAKI